jgi:2'-5' RNA ligase
MDRSKNHSLRLFVCIELPESVRERISELQAALKKLPASVSWTKPSNVHLTIKFLGDTPVSRVASIADAVTNAAADIPQFELEVGGAGCFPSPRRPRVLWVGFGQIPEALHRLQKRIDSGLHQLGFPRESREFSPHLTIGRIRTPEGASQVAEDLMQTGFPLERFAVTRIVVMKSDLKPTGSIYTPQAVIELH